MKMEYLFFYSRAGKVLFGSCCSYRKCLLTHVSWFFARDRIWDIELPDDKMEMKLINYRMCLTMSVEEHKKEVFHKSILMKWNTVQKQHTW